MKPRAPVRPELVRVLKPGLDLGSGEEQKLFVVGFDPGVKTGWCVMRINYLALVHGGLSGVCLAHPDPEVFSWSAGYFEGPEPYQAELMMALMRGTWMHGEGVFDAGEASDLFVGAVEGFSLREFSRDDSLLAPVRVSAAFDAVAYRSLVVPLVRQTPADAMKVLPDGVLRRLNLWSGPDGKDGEHQRDATRHAGLLARKCADARWLAGILPRMGWLSNS